MASASNRYADALLAVTREQGCTAEVDRDLGILRQALGQGDLRLFLENPAVPRTKKESALLEILALGGEAVHDTTKKVLRVLFERGRQSQLLQIVEAYHRKALEEKGEVEGQLTTALPLEDAELENLRATLSKAMGSEVRLEVAVDGDLLGGFRALVGDRLFDASLEGQLETLGRKLKGVPISKN